MMDYRDFHRRDIPHHEDFKEWQERRKDVRRRTTSPPFDTDEPLEKVEQTTVVPQTMIAPPLRQPSPVSKSKHYRQYKQVRPPVTPMDSRSAYEASILSPQQQQQRRPSAYVSGQGLPPVNPSQLSVASSAQPPVSAAPVINIQAPLPAPIPPSAPIVSYQPPIEVPKIIPQVDTSAITATTNALLAMADQLRDALRRETQARSMLESKVHRLQLNQDQVQNGGASNGVGIDALNERLRELEMQLVSQAKQADFNARNPRGRHGEELASIDVVEDLGTQLMKVKTVVDKSQEQERLSRDRFEDLLNELKGTIVRVNEEVGGIKQAFSVGQHDQDARLRQHALDLQMHAEKIRAEEETEKQLVVDVALLQQGDERTRSQMQALNSELRALKSVTVQTVEQQVSGLKNVIEQIIKTASHEKTNADWIHKYLTEQGDSQKRLMDSRFSELSRAVSDAGDVCAKREQAAEDRSKRRVDTLDVELRQYIDAKLGDVYATMEVMKDESVAESARLRSEMTLLADIVKDKCFSKIHELRMQLLEYEKKDEAELKGLHEDVSRVQRKLEKHKNQIIQHHNTMVTKDDFRALEEVVDREIRERENDEEEVLKQLGVLDKAVQKTEEGLLVTQNHLRQLDKQNAQEQAKIRDLFRMGETRSVMDGMLAAVEEAHNFDTIQHQLLELENLAADKLNKGLTQERSYMNEQFANVLGRVDAFKQETEACLTEMEEREHKLLNERMQDINKALEAQQQGMQDQHAAIHANLDQHEASIVSTRELVEKYAQETRDAFTQQADEAAAERKKTEEDARIAAEREREAQREAAAKAEEEKREIDEQASLIHMVMETRAVLNGMLSTVEDVYNHEERQAQLREFENKVEFTLRSDMDRIQESVDRISDDNRQLNNYVHGKLQIALDTVKEIQDKQLAAVDARELASIIGSPSGGSLIQAPQARGRGGGGGGGGGGEMDFKQGTPVMSVTFGRAGDGSVNNNNNNNNTSASLPGAVNQSPQQLQQAQQVLDPIAAYEAERRARDEEEIRREVEMREVARRRKADRERREKLAKAEEERLSREEKELDDAEAALKELERKQAQAEKRHHEKEQSLEDERREIDRREKARKQEENEERDRRRAERKREREEAEERERKRREEERKKTKQEEQERARQKQKEADDKKKEEEDAERERKRQARLAKKRKEWAEEAEEEERQRKRRENGEHDSTFITQPPGTETGDEGQTLSTLAPMDADDARNRGDGDSSSSSSSSSSSTKNNNDDVDRDGIPDSEVKPDVSTFGTMFVEATPAPSRDQGATGSGSGSGAEATSATRNNNDDIDRDGVPDSQVKLDDGKGFGTIFEIPEGAEDEQIPRPVALS